MSNKFCLLTIVTDFHFSFLSHCVVVFFLKNCPSLNLAVLDCIEVNYKVTFIVLSFETVFDIRYHRYVNQTHTLHQAHVFFDIHVFS